MELLLCAKGDEGSLSSPSPVSQQLWSIDLMSLKLVMAFISSIAEMAKSKSPFFASPWTRQDTIAESLGGAWMFWAGEVQVL